MQAERCATENELLAFAEGQLRGENHTWVERHVDGCSDCADLLAEVLRDDSVPGSDRRTGDHEPDDLPPRSRDRPELATMVDGGLDRTPVVALRQALASDSAQGLRLGRYLLLERLGQGAMGFVYTAYDPELARTVALKVIRPELDGGKNRGAARARLIREAQAAARIEHPNLVAIYEVGQADDEAYIAMEYVKGQTVRTWMTAGTRPRPWRATLGVFLQAGAALAAAHRGRVLHRDFKPDNILLDDEGRARVVDFGLAVGVHDELGTGDSRHDGEVEAEPGPARSLTTLAGSHLDLRMTMTGSVLGTPAYMAPEQHKSAKVDARADQYAFAASLYEALHGVRPFTARHMTGLLAAKRADKIEEGERAGVPRWLRAVVVRALASDPAARWPDMPAMLAALQANPTRRRVAVGLAAFLSVGLIAGMAWQARQRAEIAAACVAEGQAIEALWTEPRVAEMRAAFAATGLPFAADSWRRVEQRIGGWVAAYADARAEMCRAGELEGRVEPAVLAQARACFDDRKKALADATRDWSAADIQRVTRAPGMAANFAPLSECTDLSLLTRRLEIERAGGTAEVDRARLRDGWKQARRLAYQGDDEGAMTLAHTLADEAARLHAMSLASALSLTECSALTNLQRFDEAQAACERSFMQTVMATDHEGALHTAAALSNLASQDPHSQERHKRAGANLWLDLAEAHHTFIAAPTGQPDAALARLRAARAYFFQDFGEHDRALPEFRRAIDAYVLLQGEYSEHASYLWMAIAHIAKLERDPQTARAALDQAGRIREMIFGSRHPMSIEVALARVELMHLLEPTSVAATYPQIMALAEQTSGADSILAGSVAYQWGQWLKQDQGCAAARPMLERMFEILTRSPETRPNWLASAYLMTATCRFEAGELRPARAAAVLTRDAFGPDPDALAGPELAEARTLIEACDTALAAADPAAQRLRRGDP